ncbi:MAG: DUF3516 domain-containing protein [Bifidobacteriaceae bacterium]|jgi:superfamily II RNA helicase|nr:DUF3516 domain-containing protein [Bifidobacteriaceae bacterium]MCI1979524.1 DUF3516 domain-containing protein [Bifidobacteriaceae bacterium]
MAENESASEASSLMSYVPAKGEERSLSDDDIYDRFFTWVDSRGMTPWSHQEEAVLSLVSGEQVILSTPTGSGKSLVALGMHFAALCTGRRSYYTAPIKALVSEKFFDLVSIFGREQVGMITGDTHINTDAPIICCTAEILANQALREGASADVGCVAMDEFHYFGDSQRGWAWQVPLLTLPNTQFLLMSATLGDTSNIEDLLERKTGGPVTVIDNAERPVPLSYEYVDTPLESTITRLLDAGESPVYIVHFSQEAALSTAQDLSSFGVASKKQRQEIKEALSGFSFTTTFGKTLRRLLLTGVGVHHAGMLPRYRRLVEQLAQQGLLPVICGTDTLGVGINVPIHTVLLTALTKYDGYKQRRLRAREFHQIAGRAGRSGFDSEGLVVAQATEYDIENARAVAKAGDDPKKLKKIKRKRPPEGFVGWTEKTFDHLIEAEPETLQPHLAITHSMVLSEVTQGGDAGKRISDLIDDSAQTEKQKEDLHTRAAEIFETLESTGVVEKRQHEDDSVDYVTTVDIPEDFALDQPLSPFLLAALELLDPDSVTFNVDLISMVEATLEDPKQVLKAQQRQARDVAMAKMKEEGLDYDERMEKLADVTYPQPLKELLDEAFTKYRADVPWANDYYLHPKSVLRDMIETASDFTDYISRYSLSRSEGTLLRYLSDAYRVLSHTVPDEYFDDDLDDLVSWLRLIVRTVDSSLVDEWEAAGQTGTEDQERAAHAAPPTRRVVDDKRGLTMLVRNALFKRVELIATENSAELGRLDSDYGMQQRAWNDTLDDLYADHEEFLTNTDSRSAKFFILDDSKEKADHTWHVRQILNDADGDHDWAIDATVELDATQERGEVVFKNYRVDTIENLL